MNASNCFSDHINHAFSWWVNKFHNGNQTLAAAELGISRASINGLMSSDSANPGYNVLRKAYELHKSQINKSWWFDGLGTPDNLSYDKEMQTLREQNRKMKQGMDEIEKDILSKKSLFS